MAYLGSTPETQSFTSGTDYFNGDGISVAFTLSRPVASVNDIEVVISNVVQQPSTAYTVSGTTITFTSAPPAGTANVYARYLSTVTQTITPSPGTVGTSQLSPSLTNIPFFGGSTLGAGNATGMKNRIINGAMVIDQRNAGASVTIGAATPTYTLDRWLAYGNAGSAISVQKSTTAPTGFTNSLLVTSLAATSVSSTDTYWIRQYIEGYNVADLGWGTASAKTVTVSFWVRSSLTGTFGGALRNSAANRSYPFTYTISSANTWEQKSVTVAGDTTGTWVTDNGVGLTIMFGLGVGSTYSGPAGAWAGTNYNSATGATSVVGTSGATFYITGVQLEEGNAATSFDFRDYGRELAMCQRYYQQTGKTGNTSYHPYCIGALANATTATFILPLPVVMRAAPAFTFTNPTNTLVTSFSGGVAPSSVNPDVSTPSNIMFYANLSSSLTGGQACRLIQNAAAFSSLELSAEL